MKSFTSGCASRFLLVLVSVLVAASCATPPVPNAVKRPNYPSLAPETKYYSWLAIKCQLSDVQTIPTGLDDTIDHFLTPKGDGYGNIRDYFGDVSYGAASLSIVVSGWFAAPYDSRNVLALSRQQRIEKCLDAIPENQRFDISSFYGIIGIENGINDAGYCGASGQKTLNFWGKSHTLACVWFDPASFFTDFAAHEIGHGLGLDHSFDDSGRHCQDANPGEYCDRWDIMSAMGVYWFEDNNWPQIPDMGHGPSPARSGPGMSLPSLLKMGWIPARNFRFWNAGSLGSREVRLTALSHPTADGVLALQIVAGGTHRYSVEYRQAEGWDRGFWSNTNVPFEVRGQGGAVLVHRLQSTEPVGILVSTSREGALLPGDSWTVPAAFGSVIIHVLSFDLVQRTALIKVGAFAR